ncbi:ParE toxin of type II toxin-antitoxin system, parDE [uncultured archaeon]|nr:ParE toxin of type II toxin-antitoxin system, parDE [uncultured archaeon]
MVNFEVLIDEDAQKFLDNLPEKNQENVRSKLMLLEEDPFPGPGGNKELLNPKQKKLYRLHISRNYTAFYHIFSEEKTVRILWLGHIGQAHNLYGRFKN